MAFCACFRTPLSPTTIDIVTPANISKTIIVIIKAIRVIPLFSFVFFIFPLPPSNFFNRKDY